MNSRVDHNNLISINELVSTVVDHIGYGPKRFTNDNIATRVYPQK